MKYFFVTTLLFFSLQAFTQDCNKQLLIQKPGIWKESSGGTSNVSTTDLAKEKKVLTAINTMIKSKYSPKGVSALMNESYDRPESIMPCNSYHYSIHPLNYYCDGNAVKIDDETSTTFELSVNHFDVDIYDTAQGRALDEGFNVMPHLPVEKDGYWFFKEIDASLGFQMSGKSCMWLITYDGKLPYSYVSKKEFLEKRKHSLFILMEQSASSIKDNLKTIELEKTLTEKELKNDPEKLKSYLKNGYQYKKDKYQKFLEDNEKVFKPAFDDIEKQLRMSTEILSQKAIVKRDPNDTYKYLFTDDNDKFGNVLIKPNPSYFNKKLSKTVPQFFLIYITWNHNEPIATKFREDIMSAIDFATLKNMLGK